MPKNREIDDQEELEVGTKLGTARAYLVLRKYLVLLRAPRCSANAQTLGSRVVWGVTICGSDPRILEACLGPWDCPA